jgi:hypothetical protein
VTSLKEEVSSLFVFGVRKPSKDKKPAMAIRKAPNQIQTTAG